MNNERELIRQCRIILDEAEKALDREDLTNFASHMSNLLNHLIAELVGGPEQQGGPGLAAESEQPAAEPEQPAAESEQRYGPDLPDDKATSKAKSDAAARRKAGNWPY